MKDNTASCGRLSALNSHHRQIHASQTNHTSPSPKRISWRQFEIISSYRCVGKATRNNSLQENFQGQNSAPVASWEITALPAFPNWWRGAHGSLLENSATFEPRFSTHPVFRSQNSRSPTHSECWSKVHAASYYATHASDAGGRLLRDRCDVITAVTSPGVGDDSDGAQQLVDGVDEVLVRCRDALDTGRRHGRHRHVVQIGVELEARAHTHTPRSI